MWICVRGAMGARWLVEDDLRDFAASMADYLSDLGFHCIHEDLDDPMGERPDPVLQWHL